MPTQVLTLDVRQREDLIALRQDTTAIFVLATDAGRPAAVRWLPRPQGAAIRASELLDLLGPVRRATHTSAPRVPARISIVICTHERPDDLRRCLDALAPARSSGHEVIVVDNAPSTDRTAAVLRAAGVRRLVERRQGLDHARNAGLAASSHAIVAFVDDDVVVSPSWAEAIAGSFDDQDVTCVTGLVLPFELETVAQEAFERYSQHRRDLEPARYSRETLRPSAAGVAGMGANMAFRRDVLAQLGGFDPRLDAGTRTHSGGDTDMFARVLDAGHIIAYVPDAFVWHRHRLTDADVRRCVFGYGVGLYSVMTKRLLEQGDAGALITSARWLLGPIVKAARARLSGTPSPPWSVVLSETAGALCGPGRFVAESWHRRGGRDA